MNINFLSPDEQLHLLKKGLVDLVSQEELLKKLEKSYKKNIPLKIKAGFDPTRPDIHLGHTVLINKLKQFQDLGHDVIFLIGNFTATIGDPTGKNETRPSLSTEEVCEYAKTYANQAFKILDKNKTQIVYNNDWFSKFTAYDFIKLSGKYTLSRMLERDDFKKRFKSEQPISIHEFLYPLIQGYDSVVLHADVEIGGTDQLFNLLVARDIQKSYQQEPQCILTTPILEGLDGIQKMSKSLNNYIAIEDSPKEMFGKIMSISDTLMFKYYELLTDITLDELDLLKTEVQKSIKHPKEIKIQLAKEIVKRFHNKENADKSEKEFNNIFTNKGLPEDISTYPINEENDLWICKLLTESKLASSGNEARRLIKSEAVSINGEKINDVNFHINLKNYNEIIIKVGKRKFLKIIKQ